MHDQLDETAEIYRVFGDFLHEVPEAEPAVRKVWRIARMREVRERAEMRHAAVPVEHQDQGDEA
ncbi:hypothetical protein GGQ99_005114 [Aminobacter niigataensis]|uniref:Uncharacterized protein n=1 Tax=Aminobacter niigataensis TaxID=83265 RepID=A0ABR6LAR7_9HYPH|nr:hypothetical protein [Aminobacter niigataensis]MBB4653324.1 hypothetical protein [Aminobacter niigataensis]